MKTLKFLSKFKEGILNGAKTNTWRLFDDKNLQIGDEVAFIDSDTKESFGNGVIIDVKEICLKEVDLNTIDEKYGSYDAMYERLRGYYGDSVGPDTVLKIVEFKLK
jgi:hypothetical protein